MKTHSHGIVTGYRSEDQARYMKIPVADIKAGRCVSCRAEVFLNRFGVSAVRERDADVICRNCDRVEGQSVDRSLIES